MYVGTSAAEILHFVQIPPDPSDISDAPSYILASRLSPTFSETTTPERPGVQQILLLPAANKACVLCNSTVTFYSLPELSPVFNNQKVPGSNWIGGLDLNKSQDDNTQGEKIRPARPTTGASERLKLGPARACTWAPREIRYVAQLPDGSGQDRRPCSNSPRKSSEPRTPAS